MSTDVNSYIDFVTDVINLMRRPLRNMGVIFWHAGDRQNLHIPELLEKRLKDEGWCVPKVKKWQEDKILCITKQPDYYWNDKYDYGDTWDLPTEFVGVHMCKKCKAVYTHKNIELITRVLTEGDFERNGVMMTQFVGLEGGLKCPCGSTEFISHLAAFPPELVERCMLLSTKEGDKEHPVLDPFAGTGTVGYQGTRMHRKVTLIENTPEFLQIIEQRLKMADYENNVEQYGEEYAKSAEKWGWKP